MADIQKLKELIADWETTSDDIPFGLDEDDRVILEAMKFAADNHDIIARLEAVEERADNLNIGWLKVIEERDEARAQLAELEKQEPVAYWHRSGQVVTREECHDDNIFKICCKVERPLFTLAAPPAPFVVKNFPARKSPSDYVDESFGNDDLAAIWNSCRLACKVKIQDAGGSVADGN